MTKKKPATVQPRPNRDGIYPAETWRQSNPGYEKDEPLSDGRWAQVDAGTWYDYVKGLEAIGRG